MKHSHDTEDLLARFYPEQKSSSTRLLLFAASVLVLSAAGILFIGQRVVRQDQTVSITKPKATTQASCTSEFTEPLHGCNQSCDNDQDCESPLSCVQTPIPLCPRGSVCAQKALPPKVCRPIHDKTGDTCTDWVTGTPRATVTVSPTCRPRPTCLDATPACDLPITTDMCPPSTISSVIPNAPPWFNLLPDNLHHFIELLYLWVFVFHRPSDMTHVLQGIVSSSPTPIITN